MRGGSPREAEAGSRARHAGHSAGGMSIGEADIRDRIAARMATTVSATASPTQADTVAPGAMPRRLISLDIFRGMTIAGMILVNNAGNWDAVYWPLEHAKWHGWTPTDLIFPFFLFIVGVSMVLSFDTRQSGGASRAELLSHAVRRSAIIYLIGFALALGGASLHLHTVRFYGVLPRIAAVYLAASVIVLYCGRRARVAIAAGLLVGYWLLIRRITAGASGK